MRIKKNINLGIISWLNTKFSEHYKNCMVDSKENYKFELGVKELIVILFWQSGLSSLSLTTVWKEQLWWAEMHNLELIDLKAVFYSAQIILFVFVQPN